VLARRDPLTLMVRGPHNTGFAITYNAFLVTVRKINRNCFFLNLSENGRQQGDPHQCFRYEHHWASFAWTVEGKHV